MKKLVALLAVLSYVPFAHAAEGDWTHSGEFRLQYQNSMDADFDSDADDNDQMFHQRTKLGTTVRAGEKMTFNLGIVHNADWGSNADQTPDNVGIPAGTDAAGGNAGTNNALTVSEANLVWQASDVMTWKFGRISHTIADGSVVGANSFENVGKAFDGGGLVYELEPVRLTAFGVAGAKGAAGDNGGRTNIFGRFWGLSADFKTLPSWLKMANLHYIMVKRDLGSYNVNSTVVALDAEDTTRIGFTVGGDVAGVDYKATYAMYSGETKDNADATTDVDANMMDLEVGYSIPDMMNFRVYAGMHTDTGSEFGGTKNEDYNAFHYESHENAGLMDILGWGNLTYQRVGVKIAPQDDITVALEYLMFSKTEESGNVYGGNGAVAIAAAAGTEDDLGTEIDLTVSKKYTNNFSTALRYGQFAPGDAVGADLDNASQIYLEGKLTF